VERRGVRGLTALPASDLNESFAVAAIDTFVAEIDVLDPSAIAGEVNGFVACALGKPMAKLGSKSFVILKSHDHVRNLYRRILDSQLKLTEPAFPSPDIDPIAVVSEIHLAATEQFPITRVCRQSRPGDENQQKQNCCRDLGHHGGPPMYRYEKPA
jgi:hypothetical protein